MPNSLPSTIINSRYKLKTYKDFRRRTEPVTVGNITIGGDSPVRVQSMTTTPTLDTAASVAQTLSIAGVGAELVRLTAQGVAHAENLANIHREVRAAGCDVPLVADIHFNPAAAFTAAKYVEKVRINPGNFFDPGRTFRKMEFTDEEYAAELAKIRERLLPFIRLCRDNHTAIRIGVNHGSLSDRIMSRYGDGADGMVESAMEFLRIFRDEDFKNVVVSIKASDVPVMTDTVRLLVERMEAEGMAFPLHLGVTEAGNALEGRIKSAVGIGSLLTDGIGDTIRVSLSEIPEKEIPVAKYILAHMERRLDTDGCLAAPQRRKRQEKRRPTQEIGKVGGLNTTIIVGDTISKEDIPAGVLTVSAVEGDRVGQVRKVMEKAGENPVIISLEYPATLTADEVAVSAAIDFGTLLLDGYQDGIELIAPSLSKERNAEICRAIVQAAGLQRFKAEIVACPGCGRTLFDLPSVLETVKNACAHLRHLKIAVMGCIVNGPGEMAGADYGYVGAAAGNVSLYRGTECVEKNIPASEALSHLIELIKADGQWREPQA